jgi:hypothetical protein
MYLSKMDVFSAINKLLGSQRDALVVKDRSNDVIRAFDVVIAPVSGFIYEHA